MKHPTILLVLATGIIALCRTASSQSPPESLRACTRIADPGERVRCYDAQMAAMTPSPATPASPSGTAAEPAAAVTPPAVATLAPAAPATPTASTVAPARTAKFGQEDLPEGVRPPRPADEIALASTITAMRTADPDVYYISLANGQIWRQQGTQITMFFHVGNDVHIEKGFLGQYRMWTVQTGVKNWVQVTRIR